MNTPLDLDALKQRWTAQDPLLERSLRLNAALMRANLAGQAAANLAPQKRVKWFELLCHLIMIAWLGRFALQHVAELRFSIPALLIALFYVGIVVLDVQQRRVLAAVDFSAPIGTVQSRIGALRSLRLRTAKWIFLLAPLLWMPFPAILFQSLFGVDFYAHVGTLYWIINLAVALAWIPLMLLAAQFCARRFAHSPRFQEFLDAVAGPGMATTRRFGDLLAEFDAAQTQAGELPRALQDALTDRQPTGASLPATRIATLRAIARREARRLLAGILLIGSSLLGTGSLMAAHGGEAGVLVPALILHLCIVAMMVSLIHQRVRVLALDFEAAPEAIRRQLTDHMNARVQLSRTLIGLLPAVGLALALLVAQLAIDPGIGTRLGGVGWLAFGSAILIASASAYLIAMRRIPRVVSGVSARGFLRHIHGKHWQAAVRGLDSAEETPPGD